MRCFLILRSAVATSNLANTGTRQECLAVARAPLELMLTLAVMATLTTSSMTFWVVLGGAGGGSGPAGYGGGFPGGGFPGGGFPRGGSRAPLNLDAEAAVKVTFSEAFRGGERTLSVNDERVQVRIPPGVKSGSKLRLKGKGNVQPGTGRRGDLYLVIEVQSHPIWTLDGDQLRAELPVAFDELALGGMVKVMTPDGEADVTIPPGTPPGKSLRLRGKGWPGKSGRGDLLLTLDLQWPKQWSDEQRQLLEQLQSSRNGDLRQQWMQNASL